MIPHDQLIYDDETGDCLRACVASILELPILDVPNFMEHEDWPAALDAWLVTCDLYHLLFPFAATIGMAPGYHIVGWRIGEDEYHATVFLGDEMVHDPAGGVFPLLEAVDRMVLVKRFTKCPNPC